MPRWRPRRRRPAATVPGLISSPSASAHGVTVPAAMCSSRGCRHGSANGSPSALGKSKASVGPRSGIRGSLRGRPPTRHRSRDSRRHRTGRSVARSRARLSAPGRARRREKPCESGRERRRRGIGDVVVPEPCLRVGETRGGFDTEFPQHIRRHDAALARPIGRPHRHATRAGRRRVHARVAVDEHRNPVALQQQCDERRQIGVAPGPVVRREEDRPRAVGRLFEPGRVRVERAHESRHFGKRGAPAPPRGQDRRKLVRRNLAAKNRSEQHARVLDAELTAFLRSGPDQQCVVRWHRSARPRRRVARATLRPCGNQSLSQIVIS